VTDRYITSTVVYQGLEMFNAGIDLGAPWDHDYTIYLRNRMHFMPRPRLEIFINVDPCRAVENCARKGEKLDILRAVDLRRLYMREYGSIFWPETIVDGNRSIEDVARMFSLSFRRPYGPDRLGNNGDSGQPGYPGDRSTSR
jgi:thymidylate kinase